MPFHVLRKNRIIFAFALSIACLSLNGQTLPVGGDSHVNSAYPALNFGGSVYLAVGGTSTGYLQFDLSTLPAGTNVANLTKVNLVLFVSRIVTPGSIQVAEAAGAWSEYGIQAGNAPGAGAVVGTAAIPANPGFVSVDVTSSVVKWLTNPGQNNGFVISGVGSAAAFLDSKESVTTSHQAILSLQQAGPQGATGPTGPAGLTGATGPTAGRRVSRDRPGQWVLPGLRAQAGLPV